MDGAGGLRTDGPKPPELESISAISGAFSPLGRRWCGEGEDDGPNARQPLLRTSKRCSFLLKKNILFVHSVDRFFFSSTRMIPEWIRVFFFKKNIF